MESLEPVFGVSRESVSVSVGGEIESSPGQLSADEFRGVAYIDGEFRAKEAL